MHACRIISLQLTNMAMNTRLTGDEKKAGEELGAFGLLLEIRATGCVTSRQKGTEATWRLQPSTWKELCMFVIPSVLSPGYPMPHPS